MLQGIVNAQTAGGLALNPGWIPPLQDITTPCGATNTTCTMVVRATTAGSGWIMKAFNEQTSANAISGVCSGAACSGNNDNWTHATGSNVFVAAGSHGDGKAANSDIFYNTSGTTGTTSITVTLAGASLNLFYIRFIEVMPPSGSTLSLDTTATNHTDSCTTACALANLTLTATDFVMQFPDISHGTSGWNAYGNSTDCSSVFCTDYESNAVGINMRTAPSGVTFAISSAGWSIVSAIAFKSSAGTFTIAAPVFKIVQVKDTASGQPTCNPSCTVSFDTSVTAGNAVAIFTSSGAAATISTSTVPTLGGSNFTVPTAGSTTCQNTLSGSGLGCAWLLSAPGGNSAVSITMSANGSPGVTKYEISRTSGSFTQVGQGSASRTTPSTFFNGIGFTLGGTNSVLFQCNYEAGGSGELSNYFQSLTSSAFYNISNLAGCVVRLNTTDGSVPTWRPNGTNSALVTGLALQ